ncbi:uncharacterized protein LOC109823532 [Asparagus officinalis]|uniref:uncharacterized protein LOC109823532 n=1 Tax=Asparagus officinalis TaxID=4686 RepID=UPI00098E4BDF|nr:uncharacterized protein LOC109823532 [Asparagus officinalis]
MDIWQVQSKVTDSWMWRQLLKVRDMVLNRFGGRNNLQSAIENCHINGKLRISAIYNALTLPATYAAWSDTIWGGLHYPKHSVILWLNTLSRLLTKDRLCKMGILNENQCILCSAQQETSKHMFFECQFSAHIWNEIMEWSDYSWRSCNWDQIISWYSTNLKGKGYMKKIKRMTLSATVYWIWKERNLRIFQGRMHTSDQLVREIKTSILSKVLKRENAYIRPVSEGDKNFNFI